jgi:undecaprenyl diphosphate synthase
MKLTDIFYQREFKQLRDEGVHFVHLGDRENLPKSVIRVLDNIEAYNTEERRLVLSIAFNYSGRSEITRAARLLAEESARGTLQPQSIDEQSVADHLYTSDIPDVDLFIRTGGEMRISNFLLWQIAYAEIWVSDVLWPDFTGDVLRNAIGDFGKRDRRFGGV